MIGSARLFHEPGQLPGWFGKLPGLGDFAHRRMPEAFRELWDHWLQHGFARLRQQHEDWTQRYLEGPLWFFVLAPQVAGPRPWVGVLMPSVDGVGRYFPFTVAAELAQPLDAIPAADAALLVCWWQQAAQASLQALEQDLDAPRFDALLEQLPALEQAPDAPLPTWPHDGQSLWFTDPGDAHAASIRTAGLPRGARFDRLFGFDEEAEVLHRNDTDPGL